MATESLRTFRNVFEQESLIVPPRFAVEEIPPRYRDLLPASYHAWIADPPDLLARLASEAKLPVLRRWFEAMIPSRQYATIIHYAEVCGTVQSDVTCWSVIPATGRMTYFRLPVSFQYPRLLAPLMALLHRRLPSPLMALYQVTNGVTEGRDVFISGGFLPADCVGPFDYQLSPTDEQAVPFDSHQALRFYARDNGDDLLVADSEIYYYDHETQSFHPDGPLAPFIESYFEKDLTAQRRHPSPD